MTATTIKGQKIPEEMKNIRGGTIGEEGVGSRRREGGEKRGTARKPNSEEEGVKTGEEKREYLNENDGSEALLLLRRVQVGSRKMLPDPFLELLRFISPVITVLHLSEIFFGDF